MWYAYNDAGQKHNQLVEHDHCPDTEHDERWRQSAHGIVIVAVRKCSGILIIRNGMIKRAHNVNRRRRRRTAPLQADALTVTWSVSNVDHARHFSPSTALPCYNYDIFVIIITIIIRFYVYSELPVHNGILFLMITIFERSVLGFPYTVKYNYNFRLHLRLAPRVRFSLIKIQLVWKNVNHKQIQIFTIRSKIIITWR